MKKTLLSIGFVVFSGILASAQINLRFIQSEEAKQMLLQEDVTTQSWSQFDLDSRLNKNGATKEELMNFIANQTLDWNETDRKIMEDAAEYLNKQIQKQKFNLPIPQKIDLLKTTMKEEGGAGGYTRNKYIVLDSRMGETSPIRVQYILAHELFHILTRNNPKFRKQMYECIGFKIRKKELQYPEDLADHKITNPDVNRYDSYATFTINGKKENCSMVIFASKPYEGGSFFNYIKIGLVPLKGNRPIQEEGKTIVYSIEDAADFYDKVGRNTHYLINPEEILAENFSAALVNQSDMPTPKLIERIKKVLRDF